MKKLLPVLSCAVLAAGCAGPAGHQVNDAFLQRHASAGALTATHGEVLTGNDAAFAAKLQAVTAARQSIDMAYYIYGDDYSSSALTEALIEAARRGVRVRLLVDYQTNYKRLDLYSMMQALGRQGSGSLEVRFYNRPTRNVVQDAVYLTMGCGPALQQAAAAPGRCSQDKFAAIDRLFAAETIDGKPAAGRNISNLNVGHSGLLLSGLYGKRADVIAMAIQEGQGVDPAVLGQGKAANPQDKENLKKLAQVYWDSRTAPPFQRLAAKAELYLALSLYGDKLNPLYDAFTALLPVEKTFTQEAKQDWDHFTDFLHHKLLLVDEKRLQTGGRNVEDAYHMRPNALSEKYVFMDTDVVVDLAQGGDRVTRSFEQLWGFDAMVATLDEVRQHAPNDFIANLPAYAQSQAACETAGKPVDRACVDRAFEARAHSLNQRIALQQAEMQRHAKAYRSQYLDKMPPATEARFALDRDALLTLLENLPFDRHASTPSRRYAPRVGREPQAGKYLHDTWLKSLTDVCAAATPAAPRQVVLHNAYFFPPANMTHALSRMVNGELDCANVTVTVLTNSIETTDLNIVNLMARHSLKAFAEFYETKSDPKRRARFDYFEYLPQKNQANLSLHSKVSVLGDALLIGSANADVRSLVMDSNIALLIRNAPDLHRNYLAHVQALTGDKSRTQRLNDYFLRTPRDTMVKEDVANLRKLFAKYKIDQRTAAPERATLENRFVNFLDEAYELTRQSIAPEATRAEREAAQNRFNEKFKPI
jgi:putative cardiolipin synthase